jgi:prolyl 4-hydroxylase
MDLALDNLARAASVGWPAAVHELQFLARAPGSNWKKLRASADLEAWRRAPARRVLADAPRLRVFENFATPEECDWLIGACRAQLGRATVYKATADQLHVDDTRTNTEADFQFGASDIVLSLIRDRIARAAAVPVEHYEVAKLLHYAPGEAFTRHSDFFMPWMSEELETRGQRVATFLIYLNEGYEGGETEFTDAGLKFKGRKGDALLFLNVDRQGQGDPMSFHAGQPVTHGEKWVFSQWIRNKPINAYQTPRIAMTALAAEWYAEA